MTPKSPERTALFPGSFNPFTRGHQSIVDRATALFDRVVIAVGYNIAKPGGREQAAERAEAIKKLYRGNTKVNVVAYSVLTVRCAERVGAGVIIRGVRNATDFDYERGIAEVNRRLSGIETLLIPSLPEYDCVSSSMVRELKSFGEDVSDYLPEPFDISD
ncbi:MAG: pantetheine-phosphate adenylyltransferase [Candidatus Amulumruptor caecigallinarius]|nr:pantetheine-phosphate adenylyltransferase [Candidatus Amulumruptor caecigallinarius]MCM1396147.1 pantetheine-phosphate adenylyltransferase [Candidatus Amulumruptor caecigallinarius]MCM1453853.1 pantetheine-phosphate adenylyltransferase [bacterium]